MRFLAYLLTEEENVDINEEIKYFYYDYLEDGVFVDKEEEVKKEYDRKKYYLISKFGKNSIELFEFYKKNPNLYEFGKNEIGFYERIDNRIGYFENPNGVLDGYSTDSTYLYLLDKYGEIKRNILVKDMELDKEKIENKFKEICDEFIFCSENNIKTEDKILEDIFGLLGFYYSKETKKFSITNLLNETPSYVFFKGKILADFFDKENEKKTFKKFKKILNDFKDYHLIPLSCHF